MPDTKRENYYDYTPDGSGSWHLKTPPARNPEFEKALRSASGGKLRVEWAGTLKGKDGRFKYKTVWKGLTGFIYRDDNGVQVSVKTEKDVPADKLAFPVYGSVDLGRLRWVIEQFDEKRGEWGAYLWIKRANGNFRDLDNEVLEQVIRIWKYNRETSEAQKQLDDIERVRREDKEIRQAVRNEWERELTAEDHERFEEEARIREEIFTEEERKANTVTFL